MIEDKINTEVKAIATIVCANILVKDGTDYIVLERSKEKQHAPGFIVPFGGKVTGNESPVQCAIRELKEESGLIVKNLKLSAVVTEIHKSPKMIGNWLTYYFIGEYDKGSLLASPEGKALRLTREVLTRKKLFPSFALILQAMLDGSRPLIANCTYSEFNELEKSEVYIC